MSFDIVKDGFSVISKDGQELDLNKSGCVIALGTFDGVHIAHKALLNRAVTFKNEIGADLCGAFCFMESPLSLLRGTTIPQICTLDQKLELMFEAGLDFVAVGNFSAFRDVSAHSFIDVIKSRFGCIGAVCGFNHRFGKSGVGDASLLREILGDDRVITVSEIKLDGITVSSSAIRALLAEGNVEFANKMLGRNFTLCSEVIRGKGLGHTINCPTTNQNFPIGAVNLKRGIYATLCTTQDGQVYVGASNVGTRPSIDGTIDDHAFNCETLIADFSRDIYGQTLNVEFCRYLRGEQKFDSLDALSSAIHRDLESAVQYFSKKD